MTASHIDDIFTAIVGSELDISITLCTVLSEIASYVGVDVATCICRKFSELPPSQHSESTVNTLFSLLDHVVLPADIEALVIDTLWDMVQEGKGYDITVSTTAMSKLLEAALLPRCVSVRPKLLDLCVANIRESQSVYPSICLLRDLVQQLDVRPSRLVQSRLQVITALDKRFSLIEAFVADLAVYKHIARDALSPVAIAARGDTVVCPGSRATHSQVWWIWCMHALFACHVCNTYIVTLAASARPIPCTWHAAQ